MDDRIGELLRQKKELEEQIRVLRKAIMKQGTVKYDVEHFSPSIPDRHFIAVRVPYYRERKAVTKWLGITRGTTKDEAFENVPQIINDLTLLYNSYLEEKNGQVDRVDSEKEGD